MIFIRFLYDNNHTLFLTLFQFIIILIVFISVESHFYMMFGVASQTWGEELLLSLPPLSF